MAAPMTCLLKEYDLRNFGCIVVNVFTEDNEGNEGEKYKIFVNFVALCEIFYRR
jgi:hypothetical protein